MTQLSRSQETPLCPDRRVGGDGFGETCRHTYTRVTFSLLFATNIALVIITGLSKLTELEDIHHQKT